MKIREVKQIAKAAMPNGHWWNVLNCLLVDTINSAAGFLLASNLKAGNFKYYASRLEGKPVEFSETFEGFKDKRAGKGIGLSVLTWVFVSLWSLLFIIPGIIMSYAYEMVPVILLNKPETKVMDAFRESKKMMKGHKWKLFVLELSFLGWDILNIFTMGLLGVLWLNPYKKLARIQFIQENILK